MFALGETRVVREDDAYYLTAPELDAESSPTTTPVELAVTILSLVNGYTVAHHNGFRPVELEMRFTRPGTEQTYHVVQVEAHLRGRGRMTVGGPPKPSEPEGFCIGRVQSGRSRRAQLA
jgi:hypothetical protein